MHHAALEQLLGCALAQAANVHCRLRYEVHEAPQDTRGTRCIRAVHHDLARRMLNRRTTCGACDRRDECDLGAGAVAAGMDDPRELVTALASQLQRTAVTVAIDTGEYAPIPVKWTARSAMAVLVSVVALPRCGASITSTPTGATVLRDQTQIGVTPLTLSELNPGLVINTVGGCLIALAILIPYLVRNFSHRQDSASFRVNH